jgi:CheY-like chemotaxis protein
MPWNILVVDDEPINLEIICEFLDEPDYFLSTAENGEIAWTKLVAAYEDARAPIDIVLLDRMMPVLNGIELIRRIKGDPRFKAMPVIMQTAAAGTEEVREGIAEGAYYYLTKPYNPDALAAIVRSALSNVAERRRADRLASDTDDILGLMRRAEFEFRAPDEAQVLAGTLAGLCPEPATVALGLTELMMNAIEHGNLAISYAQKKFWLQSEIWLTELEKRASLPEYAGRVAVAEVDCSENEVVFTITDQGSGFDWRGYLAFDPDRACDPNGRGIAMARQVSFSRVEYQGEGNCVVAAVSRQHTRMDHEDAIGRPADAEDKE